LGFTRILEPVYSVNFWDYYELKCPAPAALLLDNKSKHIGTEGTYSKEIFQHIPSSVNVLS
jgi:hypothetical protein